MNIALAYYGKEIQEKNQFMRKNWRHFRLFLDFLDFWSNSKEIMESVCLPCGYSNDQ